MLRKLLVSLFVFAAVPAMAQFCPVSNAVGLENIGDGCSTMGAENVPHIGYFRSLFTPSCDGHDKCYTQLGADYDGCDSAFYESMRNRCDGKYNKILQPAEWSLCRSTAFEYYQAVKLLGSNAAGRRNMQNDARNRSIQMFWNVDNDVCGTTPDRTTIYSPGLTAQINGAFQSYAGRQPTVFEFMSAANAGNIVDDRTGWNALLYTRASQAAASPPPPVAWTNTMSADRFTHTLTVSPANGSYSWNVAGFTGTGPSITLMFEEPMYNTTLQIKGLLRATGPGNVKNLALIDYYVAVRGWCGSRGGACQ